MYTQLMLTQYQCNSPTTNTLKFSVLHQLIGQESLGELAVGTAQKKIFPRLVLQEYLLWVVTTDLPVSSSTNFYLFSLSMKNRSDTNASFKNRSSENVHLIKRLSAILILCSWSFFETYSFTWLIFGTCPFTWLVLHWRDRFFDCTTRLSVLDSTIQWKVSPVLGMKVKKVKSVIWLFVKIFMWIAISMESSRRDLISLI